MKKILYILSIMFAFAFGFVLSDYLNQKLSINNNAISIEDISERPLNLHQYTIDNLASTDIKKGNLKIEDVLDEDNKYISKKFMFEFSPDPDSDTKKTSSGQINFPSEGGKHPLVLMIRGYIDKDIFATGDGTRNASKYFAENGFITVAPDFLGYGDSDKEAGNIFETRFQTYTLVLSLLNSLENIEGFDGRNIFLWGHSNGGHIALTVLEITAGHYPTTLWAPVSKPFPYSVLYYTDYTIDGGKLIRKELAKLENNHDVNNFSLTNYLDKINAPIQLHQGTKDDAVPVSWSRELAKKLKDKEVNVSYFEYAGDDHNLSRSWNEVVEKDITFFTENMIN
jgi:dipeptidyl aminopeptidase/acylaminoacyl peptidase